MQLFAVGLIYFAGVLSLLLSDRNTKILYYSKSTKPNSSRDPLRLPMIHLAGGTEHTCVYLHQSGDCCSTVTDVF